MTIWILALVLIASLAGLGLRQGAIRVAFSFVGIVFGAVLASPIGNLLSPIFGKLPLWGWILGPVIVFIIILSAFKIAGAKVHRKTYAHYKHNCSDFEWALWERMNQRVGLCVGVANGALYLMLVSFAIYTPTYWTYQLGQSDAAQNSTAMKVLNRLGEDLQRTGMSKVAGAIRSMPDDYYDAGDIVGLVYNNPVLTDRLSHYPDFINLSQKPELQEIANDPDLARMRDQGAPISQLIDNPKVQAVLNNKALVRSIWNTLTPDLKDMRVYLETDKSGKYDSEKILGKWNFNAAIAKSAFRKAKPTVTLTDMRNFRIWMNAYANTTFLAGPPPDCVVVLAGIPSDKPGVTMTAQGTWKPNGTDSYILTLNSAVGTQDFTASVENGRLTITYTSYSLGFSKAD